jgi:hypothetical protein
MQHEGAVFLPREPVFDEAEETLEGVLFADPEVGPYVITKIDAVRIVGNEIWVLNRPFLHNQQFYHLRNRGISAQSGRSVISRYNKFNGEFIAHERLSLYEATAIENLSHTRNFVIFGVTDPFIEDGKPKGTPSVMVYSSETNEEVSVQPISTPVELYYTYLPLLEAKFSEDGYELRLRNGTSSTTRYFMTSELGASYLFDHESGSLPLELAPWHYTYLESPESGSFQVDPRIEDAYTSFDASVKYLLFSGANRDYLLISAKKDEVRAYTFSLPLEEACYEFLYRWSLHGELVYGNNCKIEKGPAAVTGNRLWIGHGDRVFSTLLPE